VRRRSPSRSAAGDQIGVARRAKSGTDQAEEAVQQISGWAFDTPTVRMR